MGLDLSNLSNYTKENSGILITDSVVNAKTLPLVNLQRGVKHIDALNIIEHDLKLQNGSCVTTPSGTTTFDQKDIKVGKFVHYDEKCLDDLEPKWTGELMKDGSYNEELPFEEVYSNHISGLIAEHVENVIWRGDTSSGSGYLGYADGFLKNLDDCGNYVDITGYTGFDTSNAIDIIDDMILNLDEEVIEKEDLTLFISRKDFITLTQAFRDQNFFDSSFHKEANADGTYMLPGYDNVRVAVAPGLKGAKDIILCPASTLYVGTDMENDWEQFNIAYDEFEDLVKERVKFKIGTQVAFCKYVVRYDY